MGGIKAERQAEGVQPNVVDLYHAIMEGAVERVRPKMMTVVAIMVGLLPISVVDGHGIGSHEPHYRAHGRRDDLLDGADAGVIPALYALVKLNGARNGAWKRLCRCHGWPPIAPAQ